MTLREITKRIEATVLLGEDKLDMEVDNVFASDLMSNVLTLHDTPMLITGLCNMQTIHTCDMANLEVIVFVRSKQPTESMIELARESDMVLLATDYSMFRACGVLYEAGLKTLF